MIIYYKCYKTHEMSAQQYIMIGGVAPIHNLVVEILIPTRRLSVLPFCAHEGCVNCLILVGALFSMNTISAKNKSLILIHLLTRQRCRRLTLFVALWIPTV